MLEGFCRARAMRFVNVLAAPGVGPAFPLPELHFASKSNSKIEVHRLPNAFCIWRS